jgi:hypothetical protein
VDILLSKIHSSKAAENQEQMEPAAYHDLFSPRFQPPQMSHFTNSQMSSGYDNRDTFGDFSSMVLKALRRQGVQGAL